MASQADGRTPRRSPETVEVRVYLWHSQLKRFRDGAWHLSAELPKVRSLRFLCTLSYGRKLRNVDLVQALDPVPRLRPRALAHAITAALRLATGGPVSTINPNVIDTTLLSS